MSNAKNNVLSYPKYKLGDVVYVQSTEPEFTGKAIVWTSEVSLHYNINWDRWEWYYKVVYDKDTLTRFVHESELWLVSEVTAPSHS